MGRTGERDGKLDYLEDQALTEAVHAATDRVLSGEEPQPRQSIADLEDEVVEPTNAVADVEAEEAIEEASDEEVSVVSEETDVEPVEVDEETAEDEEVVDVTAEDEDGLIPRNEDGTFAERFSGVDPAKLPPELQTVYKSMQADFTRKSQANSEKAAVLEARMSDYNEFLQEVASDDGVVRLGVELYMNRPETFNKMLEQVRSLAEDPREQELWRRETDLMARERARLREERTVEARREREISTRATVLAREAATQYGIPFASIEAYLDNAIVIHRHNNNGKITEENVKAILDDYVKPYAEMKRQSAKAKAKEKAGKARSAQAAGKRTPSGTAAPGSKPPPRPNFNTIDEAVDAAIFGK